MTGFHFRSNLTFANTQDIFAIFEDEMFVEVFPRLDNIQRLAQDIVSNSDFKFRPISVIIISGATGARRTEGAKVFKLYSTLYFILSHPSTRRNENQKANGQKVRVKKRIIDLEKGVILAKKA